MTGVLSGDETVFYRRDGPVAAAMAGGKWLRQGDYKAVMVPPPFGQGEWQLLNLAKDPGKTDDLSSTHPQKLEELKTAWKQYAAEVSVVETAGAISR